MMFNGSGCKDPTAYLAIKTVVKEERRKMAAHGYADGDIVIIETSSGGEMEVLLLKCHTAYATGLKLTDLRPEENGMAIRSKKMMYTDTGRFCYAFYDKTISLVLTLDEAEYKSVRNEVAKTMGFEIGTAGGCFGRRKQSSLISTLTCWLNRLETGWHPEETCVTKLSRPRQSVTYTRSCSSSLWREEMQNGRGKT